MDIIRTIIKQAQKNEVDDQETIPVQKKFFFRLLSARDEENRVFRTKMLIAFSMSIMVLGIVTILYFQEKIESLHEEYSASSATVPEQILQSDEIHQENT